MRLILFWLRRSDGKTAANHWVLATPGYARLLFESQGPGAPDPER
jgi:hypothetical protein